MNHSQTFKYMGESNFLIKSMDITYGGAPMNLQLVAPELELFKDTRTKEKSEMQNLNSRLANYLGLSKNNSTINMELMQELEDVKNGIRKETAAIKEIYEAEMAQLRNLLDETESEKNEAKLNAENSTEVCEELLERIHEIEELISKDEGKIKELDGLLSTYDMKVSQLEDKLQFLLDEKNKDNELIKKFRADIEMTKNDLSNEIIIHADAQNRCQSLNEDIDFIQDVHQKEIKNLTELANFDPINQSKNWWNNEFANCIKEIQNEYEKRLSCMRNEIDNQYSVQIQDVESSVLQSSYKTNIFDEYSSLKSTANDIESQNSDIAKKNAKLKNHNEQLSREIKELQSQFDSLVTEKDSEMFQIREHFENALAELQIIVANNISLQMEIMSYKKLLEYEEQRMGINVNEEKHESSDDYQLNSINNNNIEMVPKKQERKISYQKYSICSLSISECNSEGNYIILTNTDHINGQNLDGWKIVQNIDGLKEYVYKFPRYYLASGESLKIWAADAGPRGPNDLVWTDRPTLGLGERVTTTLLNPKDKEKSSFIQTAVYRV